MAGGSRLWALVAALAVLPGNRADAQQRDPLLQELASTSAAFVFEVIRGPRTATYSFDKVNQPLVATTYRVRVTHVLKDHPSLGRVGTVVTVGYYGGKARWKGQILDLEVANARHFVVGRVYLGFGFYLPDYGRFHLAGRQTFEATPSGLQVFDEGSVEGSAVLDRVIAGRNLPQLIAYIEDQRAVARQRVTDAAARTAALPAISWSSPAVSSIYSIVVREVCHGPRGRPGAPVIARELAQPPRFASVYSSPAALAKALSVDPVLVDRLQALTEARLPDDASAMLGRLTEAATLLELGDFDFFPAFYARYPLATALVHLSPIAFDDTASTALVYCSATYGNLGGEGYIVSLARVGGAWVITTRHLQWQS